MVCVASTRVRFKRRKRKGNKIQIPAFASRKSEYGFNTNGAAQQSVLPKTATVKPSVTSFCIPAHPYTPTKLEEQAFEWICSELVEIVYEEDSIVPIVPSTNSVRMSHQTPQALRVFFSATTDTSVNIPSPLPCSSTATCTNPENLEFQTTKENAAERDPPKPPAITRRSAMRSSSEGPTTAQRIATNAACRINGNLHLAGTENLSRNGFHRTSQWPLRQKKNKAKNAKRTVRRKQNNAKILKSAVRKNMEKAMSDETEKLYSYGLLSVLNTTGFHPSKDIKVRPYSEKLKSIVGLLEEEVKKHLSPNATHHTHNLKFNSLEVKLYHGKDIYHDDTGVPLVDGLRDDCNKKVNLHNDVCFSDEGVQSPRDTCRGDHPIATLTIGSPRELTFVHKWKTDKKWENGVEKEKFLLDQGSIFVLLPDDEIPRSIGSKLHKTQHEANFKGEGISVALVFRSVKTKTTFHKRTHRWVWKDDSSHNKRVRHYLKKNAKWHDQLREGGKKTMPPEIKGMMANVRRFLNCKRLERYGRKHTKIKLC